MRIPYNYALYLVTDSELCPRENLLAQVEGALKGGVTMVQLREKDLGSLAFYQTAVRMKALTDRYHVPLIINDRLDIALAVDAAGVHVGQSDLPASVVRRLVGPEKLVGVSASTVAEAVIAYNDGADYLGVGAVFPTSTKKDAVNIKDSIAMLTAIHAVLCPFPWWESAVSMKRILISFTAPISTVWPWCLPLCAPRTRGRPLKDCWPAQIVFKENCHGFSRRDL